MKPAVKASLKPPPKPKPGRENIEESEKEEETTLPSTSKVSALDKEIALLRSRVIKQDAELKQLKKVLMNESMNQLFKRN